MTLPTGTPAANDSLIGVQSGAVKQFSRALPSYAKASLPAASGLTGVLVYVTDEAGGATPAFSDGTNWRRVADRAVVS